MIKREERIEVICVIRCDNLAACEFAHENDVADVLGVVRIEKRRVHSRKRWEVAAGRTRISRKFIPRLLVRCWQTKTREKHRHCCPPFVIAYLFVLRSISECRERLFASSLNHLELEQSRPSTSHFVIARCAPKNVRVTLQFNTANQTSSAYLFLIIITMQCATVF